jgi:hypothetical protein
MNRRQRRAAEAQARSKTLAAIVWRDLPLMQITLSKGGAPDKTLTLGPNNLLSYLTICTLEHASKQPIDEEVFKTIAGTLHVELTAQFRHNVHSIIIGTALMITHRYYSPRKLAALFEDLRRDPLKTIAETRGDSFAEFVIGAVEDWTKATGKASNIAIDEHIAAIRETIPPGRPDEEARSIFFESIVATARGYGDNLALPQRDDPNAPVTSLCQFGSEMTDLIVEYGEAMLERMQLPPGRFDSFAQLEPRQLIRRLEIARARILREKPISYQ